VIFLKNHKLLYKIIIVLIIKMNIKIQDENIISSDRYLTENCNDFNEVIKMRNEENEKIIFSPKITKNEKVILTPSKFNAPLKIKDELRKKFILKFNRNESKKINNPININNIKIVNNYKIKKLRKEKTSVNFDKLCSNMKVFNSINYIANKKSQILDNRERMNDIYGVSPKKDSRNLEVKLKDLITERNIFLKIKLNTEGNIKKEEKEEKIIEKLNESDSKNIMFKFRNLNSEEKEKIKEELEKRLLRKRSEIKKREKDESERMEKKYLQELIKKKEKDEELKEELKEERAKRKKLRKRLDKIVERREKASQKRLLIKSLETKKKKLKIKIEIEESKIKREQNNIIKQKEEEEKKRLEEEKIQNDIEELKKKAKEEAEIDMKEDEMDDKESKHKYRLKMLSELTKKYLEIYKLKDRENRTKIFEIINKIGKIYKKEIDYDKEFKKGSFIYVSDAVESKDSLIKFLGILGEEYRKYNIYSIIEKKSDDDELMDGIFKVLLCTYSILPKYEIKVYSEKLKEKFLKNPKEWLNFVDNFKQKISTEYSIACSKFYIFSNRIDLYEFTFIILGKVSFNLKRYEKLFQVKIRKDSLLEYVKLSPSFFEIKYNREINDWEKKNFKRGGEVYTPPYGWKGFALRVLNKFDDGNNSWLGNEGKEGEWAIAYHGVGKGNIFKKMINIILNNLKNGPGQLYKLLINVRYKYNKRPLVDEGVYLAPDINEAERYAEKVKLGNRKNNFQVIIMCRVKPSEIREAGRYPFNWILDSSYDCLRPYRILIKET